MYRVSGRPSHCGTLPETRRCLGQPLRLLYAAPCEPFGARRWGAHEPSGPTHEHRPIRCRSLRSRRHSRRTPTRRPRSRSTPCSSTIRWAASCWPIRGRSRTPRTHGAACIGRTRTAAACGRCSSRRDIESVRRHTAATSASTPTSSTGCRNFATRCPACSRRAARTKRSTRTKTRSFCSSLVIPTMHSGRATATAASEASSSRSPMRRQRSRQCAKNW